MNLPELYQSYLDEEEHPFIEAAEQIKNKYCDIHNKYRLNDFSDSKLEKQYLGFKSAGSRHVSFYGEETWRYGGYEEHQLDIPAEFFTDSETALKKFEEEKRKEYEAFTKKKAAAEKKADLKEFERLTKKLEPNTEGAD